MKVILQTLIFIFSFNICFSQTKTFNVLYLNSYNIGYGWSDSISKGVRKSLSSPDIFLYLECIDAKRFGQSKFDVFFSYLKEKYKTTSFDLIITSDNDALDFIYRYEDYLFPKIPVVFCGIANPEDYNFEGSNKYGIVESVNPEKTVPMLSRLLPKATSLLFITDNTTSGLIMIKKLEKTGKLFPSLKINTITEIDSTEILKTVQQGDKGDIVYLTGTNRDKFGNQIDYIDFFTKIASASTKPVFADNESVIGKNIVGGNSNKGFTQGYQAGLLALKILRKESPEKIQHINIVSDEYIFDYRLLKKFGIRKKNLPEGSVIINQPIVQYGRYIVLLLIAILALSVVIIVLTILNKKRLKAEKKVTEQLKIINDRNALLEKSYSQLSDMNCELEEANAQLQSMNKSLEEAKDKAEESEKLKSSFLANLSHEIRTPLNAILGFSSLLAESKVPVESKKNYSEIIQSNSESLLVLIDDILDFSRIEAGQVKIQLEYILIDQVLKELYGSFIQKTTPELKLTLTTHPGPEIIMIETDKIRFKQILGNLLTNAFKFTEKGEIEIGYELLNGSEIKFFVKDTGIGIDKKHHATVFERFRKLEGRSKYYSGSGLGLAICKKLTDLLGGRIWAEGETGKGSQFYFVHPGYTFLLNQVNEKNTVKQKIEFNWKNKIIAIAEDEENNYLLLERIIVKQGAEVIWFKDGEAIVSYFSGLKENNISLILMDIKMPNMDGYQALEKIRALFPNIPVIAQTAHAMGEDIKKITRNGFNDYLTKPININILKEKLNKFLS